MTPVNPRPGMYVAPDGWRGASGELIRSDWSEAQFRIISGTPATSPTDSGMIEPAINLTLTGRSVQFAPHNRAPRVRVRIEWIGDGEPSEYSHGWLYL